MTDPPPPPAWPPGPPAQVTPALSGVWQRLHPLSPLVRAGPALVIIAVTLLVGRSSHGNDSGELIRLGLVVFFVVVGAISWAVTRWRVADGAIQIDTGLLRRSSLRFPLTQIQAIDIVRPGVARIFGLAELRVRIASGGRSTGRLAYMPERNAEAVRRHLLEMVAASATRTVAPALPGVPVLPGAPAPVPAFTPLYRVDQGRLVASILLGGPAVTLYLIVAGLIVLAVVSPGAVGGVVAGSTGSIVAFASAAWARFNGQFGLNLGTGPDGLHLNTGLVETTAETIPWGRIQALRTIQPLLWRPFGWARVEVDLAGRNVSGRGNRAAKRAGRALIPVGTVTEASRLVQLVMPGLPEGPAGPPRRAAWKAPLRYRQLSFATNDTYAVTTSGRLRRVTDHVPLAKLQSIRWSEGPLQRRLRLASVHFDTAGRSVFSVARDRDADEARRLLAVLPDAARRARAAPTPRSA